MKMHDSACLELPRHHFIVLNQYRFSPRLDQRPIGVPFWKSYNNPLKSNLSRGVYEPKLTYIARGSVITLNVEFSAPKVVLGNNAEELRQTDFDTVLTKLAQAMEGMGVRVKPEYLRHAKVLRFHPSKNIVLTDGFTSSMVLTDLGKVDVVKSLDLTKVTYREGGETLQIYSQRHAFVAYDKIAEMKRPKNRAVDTEPEYKQLSLFTYREKGVLPKELLRFEIRLNDTVTIKSFLKKLGKPEKLEYQDLFNEELCKAMVQYHWNTYFDGSLFVFEANQNALKILSRIVLSGAAKRQKDAMALLGLITVAKDESGIRGLRAFMEAQSRTWSWSKEKLKLKKYSEHISKVDLKGYVKQIEKQLDDFAPLRLGGPM